MMNNNNERYHKLRKKYSLWIFLLLFPFLIGVVEVYIESNYLKNINKYTADFFIYKTLINTTTDGTQMYVAVGDLKLSGGKGELYIGRRNELSSFLLPEGTIPVWYAPGSARLAYRDNDHFDATSHIIKASIFLFLVLIFLFVLIKYLYYRNLDKKLNHQND